MSFAVVESDKLRAWCQLVLKNIEQHRERKKVEILEENLKRRNSSWACRRRFFRRQTISLQELRKAYEGWTMDWDHPWHYLKWTGGKAEDTAERLLPACLAADRVSVSSEDMEQLYGWSPSGAAEELFQQRAYR